MKRIEQQLMKEYSNMKIGGIAKSLIIPETKEEMQEIYEKYENLLLLGNGTNLLLSDGYLDYNFVSTEQLNHIESLGNQKVRVEAGVDLEQLLEFMEKRKSFRH